MIEEPARAAKRVLIVDDSEDMRVFQSIALESAGYMVLAAKDADEGFTLARKTAPDVVITDIIMNGPTGLDLISRIRSDLPPPLPAIIACSGVWELESEALRRGAVLFLAKPFVAADLVGIVAEVLAGRTAATTSGEAQRRSRWLRERIVESAASMLGSTAQPAGELARRADWTVDWISAYLGFGCAAVLFVADGDLRVLSSSDPSVIGRGVPVTGRLRLARDVVESGSTVVLGDVSAYFSPGDGKNDSLRFFAGVPLYAPNRQACGALCLFDRRPQHLEAEDLSILEHITQVGSTSIAALAAGHSSPHFLQAPMTMFRDSFESTLGCELRRASRHKLAVEVAIVKLGQPLPWAAMRETVGSAINAERAAVATLAPDQLGIYVCRRDAAHGARELAKLVDGLRGLTGVRGVGAISIQGDAIPGVSGPNLIGITTTLAERDGHDSRLGVDRIVVRREPWPEERA
jgi:CheY-like chemotaxis protein